jgi:midasin
LNLANQSVLEGLNACLDHRGEIYVPELNRTFVIHEQQSTRRQPLRIFACQNPYGQVSGRKGLPKSFLNRFTTIYFSAFQRTDLKIICQDLYSNIAEQSLAKILDFHESVQLEFHQQQWEFNLRDLLKWCQMIDGDTHKVYAAFDLIYVKRLRTEHDRQRMRHIYERTTGWPIESVPIDFLLDSKRLRVGRAPSSLSTSLDRLV